MTAATHKPYLPLHIPSVEAETHEPTAEDLADIYSPTPTEALDQLTETADPAEEWPCDSRTEYRNGYTITTLIAPRRPQLHEGARAYVAQVADRAAAELVLAQGGWREDAYGPMEDARDHEVIAVAANLLYATERWSGDSWMTD